MTSTANASSTRIDEIADDIFRISTPVPPSVVPGGFTFNQYLIRDAEPLLFHTGPRMLFDAVREAIGRVVPVATLRYVSFSHVEADECGSLNQFLAAAPQAVPLCGQVAAMVSIADLADRPPRRLPTRSVSRSAGARSSGSTRRTCRTDGSAASSPRPRRARSSAAICSRSSASSTPDHRGRHPRAQRGGTRRHGLLLALARALAGCSAAWPTRRR